MAEKQESTETTRKRKRVSKWDRPGPAAAANVASLPPKPPAHPNPLSNLKLMPALAGLTGIPGLAGINTTSHLALGRATAMGVPIHMLQPKIAISTMEPPVIDRCPEADKLRDKLIEVNKKLAEGYKEKPPEERSPSPPPVYDENGKRLNTREQRFDNECNFARSDLMGKLLKKILFRHPVLQEIKIGLKTNERALERIIWVPVDKHPDYNFAGVIIGPRGLQQKRMEQESGCSISLRGKGTRRRPNGKFYPGEDLPQHVLVKGPNAEALEKGVQLVKKALIPQSEEVRRLQLRELARLNGTLREMDPCRICGKRDHRPQACPNRDRFHAGVRCLVCGQDNHPTSDCPMRGSGASNKDLQDELGRFMREINGDLAGDPKESNGTKPIGASAGAATDMKGMKPTMAPMGGGMAKVPGVGVPRPPPGGAGATGGAALNAALMGGPSPKKIMRPCFDFQIGSCRWGAACRYQHVHDAETARKAEAFRSQGKTVCYNFATGQCRFGAQCNFLHEKGPPGGPGRGAGMGGRGMGPGPVGRGMPGRGGLGGRGMLGGRGGLGGRGRMRPGIGFARGGPPHGGPAPWNRPPHAPPPHGPPPHHRPTGMGGPPPWGQPRFQPMGYAGRGGAAPPFNNPLMQQPNRPPLPSEPKPAAPMPVGAPPSTPAAPPPGPPPPQPGMPPNNGGYYQAPQGGGMLPQHSMMGYSR